MPHRYRPVALPKVPLRLQKDDCPEKSASVLKFMGHAPPIWYVLVGLFIRGVKPNHARFMLGQLRLFGPATPDQAMLKRRSVLGFGVPLDMTRLETDAKDTAKQVFLHTAHPSKDDGVGISRHQPLQDMNPPNR